MRLCPFLFFLYLINLSGQQTIGSIELLNPKLSALVDVDAGIEALATGFHWAEGPVWVPELNGVLFTDAPNNRAYLWSEKDVLTLFLNPSGMTNHAPHSTNERANGLTLDSAGNLILCKDGLHLGTIMPGKKKANCGFDLKEEYLYHTSTDVLARIKLAKP